MLNVKESDFNKLNLIKLLREFTPREMNNFGKFVRSPFFNNQSTLIRLFDELKKYYPDFSDKSLNKELLFRKVNPDSEFNDIQFRKYISNLFKLAGEYLSYIEYDTNPVRKKLNLIEQLSKRNLNEFFGKIMNEINNNSNEKNFISSEYFYDMHLINESKIMHYIRTNKLNFIPPDLKASHNYIILQLLMTTTVYNNMLLVNKKTFKNSEIYSYIDDFLKYFNYENFYSKFDSLSVEFKNFVELCKYDLMLSKDSFNREYLEKMKSLIIGLSDALNENMLYTFMSHLNIYYLINIEKGDTCFDNELFQNYKFMIEKGIYITENIRFINYSEYRTILAIALKVREFKWAENFIEEYGKCFEGVQKNDYYNYSLAFLKFEKKEFEEALKLISLIRLDELILRLDVNIIIAMIYYELGYFSTAVSAADSFKRFLKENELISEEVKNSHLNFVNSYKALLKCRESVFDKFEIEKAVSETENQIIFRRKNWLLEKFNDILKMNMKS